MNSLPEYVENRPNLCGSEPLIETAIREHRNKPVFLPESGIDFRGINSAFAIALHMHQPLIPAGGDDLRTADIVSNLDFMMRHPEIPDAHNAPVFKQCYQRMGDFIPELLCEGLQPRVMLDY